MAEEKDQTVATQAETTEEVADEVELQQYELMYLLSPRVSDVEQGSVAEHIKKTIEKAGGKIADEVMWGKQRLAYPIQKNETGTYVVLKLLLATQSVREIDRQLRLIEPVLRHLLIQKDSQKIKMLQEQAQAAKSKRAPSLGEPSLVKRPVVTDTVSASTPEAPKSEKKVDLDELDLSADKAMERAGVTGQEDEDAVRQGHTHEQTDEEIKSIDKKLDDILDNDITK